jgi:hypothetical protein
MVQGGEARDMLLGQVFGFGAIVRSGLSIDAAAAHDMATALVHVADKKSFLREVAGKLLGPNGDSSHAGRQELVLSQRGYLGVVVGGSHRQVGRVLPTVPATCLLSVPSCCGAVRLSSC